MGKSYQPAIVRWRDHFFDDSTVSEKEALKRADKDYIITSCGFILETSKKSKYLVLYQSINEDGELSEKLFLMKKDIVEIIRYPVDPDK